MKIATFICASLLAVACSGKSVTAGDVCGRIVSAGLGANCRSESPKGLGQAASSRFVFDLAGGKTGQVLGFDDAAGYEATVEAFGKAATLAGPHRYGSPSARIFVQANASMTQADGAQLKALVESL